MTVRSVPTTPSELFEWFTRMRTGEPVSYDETTQMWHVFRYPDVLATLTDSTAYSSEPSEALQPGDEFAPIQRGNFMFLDPPRHGQLRGLAGQAFTPRFVAGMEPRVRQLTVALLDQVRDEDRFDLIAELAYPLPVTVIAEALGIPSGDLPLFRQWVDAMLGNMRMDDFDESGIDALAPTVREMCDYLLDHIRRHRAHPSDGLISRLISAEADGKALTDDEIVGFAGILLVAGIITTTATLGSVVLCLNENPGIAAEVRADESLVPGAIEETLRYATPLLWLPRKTTRPVTLGGHDLPEGAMISSWIASANRDPDVFAEPERFDLRRDPNPHLAFGRGLHFCLGAPLARLQVRVALRELFDRYPSFAPAADVPVEYYPPTAVNGLQRLLVDVRGR